MQNLTSVQKTEQPDRNLIPVSCFHIVSCYKKIVHVAYLAGSFVFTADFNGGFVNQKVALRRGIYGEPGIQKLIEHERLPDISFFRLRSQGIGQVGIFKEKFFRLLKN